MNSKYTGQKQIAGVHHKIINQIPVFSEMIELFAGSAQITKLIDLDGKKSILNDLDSELLINLEQQFYNDFFLTDKQTGVVAFIDIDAIDYLKSINRRPHRFGSNLFIFEDPPYHHSTRPNNKEIYKFEMTHEQHVELLQQSLQLKCMCMIIHPVCELYETMLKDWRKIEVKIRYHRKTSIEGIYMNYPEPTQLQDYSFLGSDSWDRQRITKRVTALKKKFEKMPVLERNKYLKILNQL